jgi:16S rRNA processing protein RimM
MQDIYPLPQDTYYLFQLVGSEVMGRSGSKIGVVEDVLNLPANDVLVVKTGTGEVLIPVTKNVVKHVDTANKTIEIEEIDGLLD